MSELLSAIEKHLGVRVVEDSLNHYSLLDLKNNAGPNEIKQALRTAIAAWNASDTKSDSESAQRVAKLIKQAQAVLLDSSKKLEYDEQLNRQALSLNRSFFPRADPFAPFDPSECLVGAGMSSAVFSFGSVNERWTELSRQIPTLVQSTVLQVAPVNRLESDRTFARETATAVRSGPAFRGEPAVRSESAASRIERLKRKRKTVQGLYIAGFLVFAAVFLGYAGMRFILNRQQIAQNQGSASVPSGPAKEPTKLTDSSTKTIGGKNAPKTTVTDSVFVLPTLDKSDSSANPRIEITDSNPFGNPPMILKTAEQIKLDLPVMEPTPSSPLTPPAITSEPIPSVPIKPVEEKPMVPAESAAMKSEWIAAMTKAKKAVDKADFETFHKQMELALPLSTSDEMVSKHARLDQLGQLYEIFIKSIHQAKSKLNAGETLSVAKTQVNIVEIKDDLLIVRIQGKNERHAWDQLPPGIAMALADLTLNNQEPTDNAARAVYFTLSPATPASKVLFAKRVKDWFEKSVGKGTIRKDLEQALTDTYE